MQHRFLHSIVFIAALGAAASGIAADKKPKEGAFGTGKGAFLTKAQLKDCMTQQARVKQAQAELTAAQDKLNTDKLNIGVLGEGLKAELETLDRTSPDAVAAYNAKAESRDKMIDAYQEQVSQFNAKVDAANADRDGWTKSCENRRYFEDDEIAIRKGK